MPYVVTVDCGSELLVTAGTSPFMLGCTGNLRVCAVNTCTHWFAIGGAEFPELANIWSGDISAEP